MGLLYLLLTLHNFYHRFLFTEYDGFYLVKLSHQNTSKRSQKGARNDMQGAEWGTIKFKYWGMEFNFTNSKTGLTCCLQSGKQRCLLASDRPSKDCLRTETDTGVN